ncbi:uncharacterized, partial [Tachysurus ichikawai]
MKTLPIHYFLFYSEDELNTSETPIE